MTIFGDSDQAILAQGNAKLDTEQVMDRFRRRLGRSPTVVSAAPGRVNLMGEHTDYNGGLCLPMALPHATYVAAAARDDRQLSVYSHQAGQMFTIDPDHLTPGGLRGWPAYAAGVLWALREDGLSLPGMDLVIDTRVPIGAGLSSSASLQCAVAVAACALAGRDLDEAQRLSLVTACQRAEHEAAGAPVGGMDQMVVLLAEEGQALRLDFGNGDVTRVPWAFEDFTVLVIDTTVRHSLADGQYAARRHECERAARFLGVPELSAAPGRRRVLARLPDETLRRRARHVLTENLRVDAAYHAIVEQDGAELGRLMDESHESLRDDFDVSCAELDLAVSVARGAGALGARMTGGGFGGSAIALVETSRASAVASAVATSARDARFPAPAFLLATPSAGARVIHVGLADTPPSPRASRDLSPRGAGTRAPSSPGVVAAPPLDPVSHLDRQEDSDVS